MKLHTIFMIQIILKIGFIKKNINSLNAFICVILNIISIRVINKNIIRLIRLDPQIMIQSNISASFKYKTLMHPHSVNIFINYLLKKLEIHILNFTKI